MSPKDPVILIPAHMQSSRLPRKALVDIHGLPMVVHVYRRCTFAKTVDEVYVATDSREIANQVESHGGKVIMTASHHATGTDRIAEAAAGLHNEVIVNVQGDEALVDPAHIDILVTEFLAKPEYNVAILVYPYSKYDSTSDIKAVLNEKNEVMYFSRSDIPSSARTPNPPMLKSYHIIPFRREFLFEYASWGESRLEKIEFNEYLRILEKGHKFLAVEVETGSISIDTPDDLAFVREAMKSDPLFPEYAPD